MYKFSEFLAKKNEGIGDAWNTVKQGAGNVWNAAKQAGYGAQAAFQTGSPQMAKYGAQNAWDALRGRDPRVHMSWGRQLPKGSYDPNAPWQARNTGAIISPAQQQQGQQSVDPEMLRQNLSNMISKMDPQRLQDIARRIFNQ